MIHPHLSLRYGLSMSVWLLENENDPTGRGRRTHGCPSWDIYVNSPSASLLHSNVPPTLSLHRMYPASDVSGPFAFVHRRGIFRRYFQHTGLQSSKKEDTLRRELTEFGNNSSLSYNMCWKETLQREQFPI